MNNYTKVSLLAPARSLESGIVAVNHGADEIYIGAPKFSARQAAGNSIEDIAALVQYAHKFRVKVYVALNTLLFDSEMEDALNLIWQIYHAGADALIIQDMGLLELDLPPIPLHASTQANNVSLDHIQFLESAGFSRVILARELSIPEITAIRQHTTISLECFVHGSLCVSYSGQCYLSHAIGNRSANRGECAQPCRLNYNLVDGNNQVLVENKHLLSLRDLNLSEYVPQLFEAGATSLKIEGRLKDDAYVANVVSYYRQKIDDFLANNSAYRKSSLGSVTTQFTPDIDKTFNRRYSQYFIQSRSNQEITSYNTPKSMGKRMGTLTKVTPGYAEIDSAEPFRNGDGICFFTADGQLQGTYINEVDGAKITPANFVDWQVGTEIYRNLDTAFEKSMQIDKTKRRISCKIQIESHGESLVFTAIIPEEDLIASMEVSDFSPATNAERALVMCDQQMRKSGNTIFEVTDVTLNTSVAPYFSAAQLNDIRRSLLEKLESVLVDSYHRVECPVLKTEHPYPISLIDYNGNITNEKAKAFYKRHGADLLRWAPEKWGYKGGEVLMTTKYCLKYSLGWCKIHQKPITEVSEPLFLTHENQRFRLDFDCKKCVMKVVKDKE
jgi:23S rRNA 5-hydroxycytidine C2501 synthase